MGSSQLATSTRGVSCLQDSCLARHMPCNPWDDEPMADSSDLLILYERVRGALAKLRAARQRVEAQLPDLDVAVVKFHEVEAEALKVGRPDVAESARQRMTLAKDQKSVLLVQLDELREQEAELIRKELLLRQQLVLMPGGLEAAARLQVGRELAALKADVAAARSPKKQAARSPGSALVGGAAIKATGESLKPADKLGVSSQVVRAQDRP